ncbi:hypothetical protein MKX01_022276 [Papaver californicum]|nr:hypothetical protein MKX01_022276 [Papaver californicum]
MHFSKPSSQQSTCQICLYSSSALSSSRTPFSSSSPTATLKWSCKACTFSNPIGRHNCEIFRTRSSASLSSDFDDLDPIDSDEKLDSSIGSVFLPLKACQNKRKVEQMSTEESSDCFLDVGESCYSKSSRKEGTFSGTTEEKKEIELHTLKVLSYNVWFREDLELHKRMKALGDLIQLHTPDVICLQEVTPAIYQIFQQSSWWKVYRCSVSYEIVNKPYFCMHWLVHVKSFSSKPFSNSIMGRELCLTKIDVGGGGSKQLNQMFSKERVAQAKEAILILKGSPNVILGGDMNWDDKLDGQFPCWVDAWSELKPGDNGYTYDSKSDQMLLGNRILQKEELQGLSYCKEKKVKGKLQKLMLPVFPSDHYGLLLTICNK